MIRRTALLTTSIAGALLLLSACGGSSSSSEAEVTAASTSASTMSAPASAGAGGPGDMTAYRDCLAENGVTLPEFGGPGGGPDGFPSGGPSGMPSGMPTGAPPSGAFGEGPAGALPDGVDQETFDAAQAACASLAPQGGFGQRGPAGGAQIDATALAAYKSCLTDHDVTLAEGDDWMRSLDRSDATVQAAMDTCAPLLPTPGAAPRTSASPAA